MAKRKSRFPSYGLVRGASHAQGGVAGMVAGEQPVELEGGEWIIPKEAVPDYLPVLKQITNEGRAMQQMDNGNTAMDALIASASMENGLTQPKSPMYQKGGRAKIEDYIKSGRTYSGDEYNEAYGDYFGDKYGGGDVGLERAESYKYSPNVLQKLLDVIPGVGGKRAYQRAKDYSEQVFNDPEASMRREGEMERGVSAYGRQLSDMVSEDDRTVKDIFMTGSLQQATEDPRNFTYDMGVSDMDKTKINQFIIGSDVGHQVSEGDSKYRSVDPYNIAQSKAGKDLFGIIPMGYSGSVRKNPGIDPQLDVDSLRQQIENMRTADFIPTQQQGGPVNQYQQGGQIQPRKQQEMRNPEVYGPPVPADIDSLLNQIMMRDVNQSINPFSGDSLNFEEDSLRLLGKMKKSHMPTYGRKKMQQGGVAGREAYCPPEPTGRQNIEAMQASGMLGQGQPLERRSLMGDANQDSRIAPMPMIEPDQYKMQLIPNAPQDTTMIEIPKLSSAYLPSLGVETPLSKRQNSLLQERQIAPQMLNSQVSGLIDRALVQRLANEPL